MTEGERRTELPGIRWRPWYVPDLLCILFLFACITLIHCSYLVWYVGGLRNRPPFMLDPYIYCLMLATPVAGVCLIALIARLVVSWPGHIHDSKRLLRLRLSVILGLTGYAGLHFVPLPQSVEDPFLLGYRKYAQTHIDVSPIQAWLSTLDPNDWQRRGNERGRLDYHLIEADRSAWSEAIIALRPDVVHPFLDDRGRPAVALLWARLHDAWGVEIGAVGMEIKPRGILHRDEASASSRATRYRLPLAPGVYVWHEVH